jgi:hypothetical protein
MNHPDLQLNIPAGAPAVAIPRKHHMLVGSILNNLKVQNGRLLINDDQWVIVCSPGIKVYGTPGLFKSIQLVGWVKSGPSSDWSIMTYADMVTENPTRLAQSFVDGVDSYPWYGLRMTWDYARGVEVE